MKSGPKVRPIAERFAENVMPEPNSGCWLWVGVVNFFGYGQLYINSRYHGAHRVSWELHQGQIPIGLFVCHKCDVPSCVNPNHLFVGTQLDNMRDAKNKGRVRKPKFKTHCVHGHSLSGYNLIMYKGCQVCRECGKIKVQRGYKPRKRAHKYCKRQ